MSPVLEQTKSKPVSEQSKLQNDSEVSPVKIKNRPGLISTGLALGGLGALAYLLGSWGVEEGEELSEAEDYFLTELYEVAHQTLKGDDLDNFVSEFESGVNVYELQQKYDLWDAGVMDEELELYLEEELPPEPAPTPTNIIYIPYKITSSTILSNNIEFYWTPETRDSIKYNLQITLHLDDSPYLSIWGNPKTYSYVNGDEWSAFLEDFYTKLSTNLEQVPGQHRPDLELLFDDVVERIQDSIDEWDMVQEMDGGEGTTPPTEDDEPLPEQLLPKPIKTKPKNLIKQLPNYTDYLTDWRWTNPSYQTPIIPKNYTFKTGNVYLKGVK